MKTSSKFLIAAGALALGIAATPQDATAEDMEKCYGVVKAGKNDCGSQANNHSCAGQAAKDGDANEWVFVPKGLCDKLVNGSTAPTAG